eukprot:3245059-Prymnesium_polylepis.1
MHVPPLAASGPVGAHPPPSPARGLAACDARLAASALAAHEACSARGRSDRPAARGSWTRRHQPRSDSRLGRCA